MSNVPFNPLTQHSSIDGKSGIDTWSRAQIKDMAKQLLTLTDQVKLLSTQMAELLEALADDESQSDTKGA
jgi:hypothetical protein